MFENDQNLDLIDSSIIQEVDDDLEVSDQEDSTFEEDFKKENIKKVECALCGNFYYRITNTHLWKHKITMEEYRLSFPDSPIECKELAMLRVDHLRGKTYEEVYGEEISQEMRTTRRIDAQIQMMSKKQRELRGESQLGRECEEEIKQVISKKKTIHGAGNYRKRALAYYGYECGRCGEEFDKKELVVHHIDFNNVPSPLGNHALENLLVLCKSCHRKLHSKLEEDQVGFVGLNNIERGVHYILIGLQKDLGLDLSDMNFIDTPKRVSRSYVEIFSGVKNTKKQIEELFESKFAAEYDSMIVSKNNLSYSMCPHHLLPVEYHVDIGYIPNVESGYVVGLSKLSRLIEIISAQPLLQETVTSRIAEEFQRNLNSKGVIVVVKGIHFCMKMRGVKKHDTNVITSAVRGCFENDSSLESRFYSLINLMK